jgi:hypothetical protein
MVEERGVTVDTTREYVAGWEFRDLYDSKR